MDGVGQIKKLAQSILSDDSYQKVKEAYIRLRAQITMMLPYRTHGDSIAEQKLWAQKWLDKRDPDYSSKGWGYVDRYNPGLGDYAKIRDLLLSKCANKCVLDLGCLDGKWSQIISDRSCSLILVDLSEELLPLLKNKISKDFLFYRTTGDELHGVRTNSVDLIFSMDSLVRVPNRKFISRYFSEFGRVLKIGGELLVHLPCSEIYGSKIRGFTKISKRDIVRDCVTNGFSIVDFNTHLVEHGVLLLAKKIS